MNKNILLAAVLGTIILYSCASPSSNASIAKEKPTELTNVTECTYQGCEYIKVGFGERAWGSHKGNCKNPIHKIN
jgi:hypothetical protein